MKTNLSFCLLLILFLSNSSFGQTVRFDYVIGVGAYHMGQLKEFQESRLRGLTVNAKLVDNYPPFIFNQLKGAIRLQKVWLGMSYRNASSGSRISYRDYSGEIRLDSRVTGNTVGFFIEKNVFKNKNYSIQAGGQYLTTLTILEVNDFIQIDQDFHLENLDFTSWGIGLEPYVQAAYQYKFFSLGIFSSLTMDIVNNDFHVVNNKYLMLEDNQGNYIRPNWSGFKIALSLGLHL